MKVFLRGPSFSGVNGRLDQGQAFFERDYNLLRQRIELTLVEDLLDGVKVFIFAKIQKGIPFAHDFGNYRTAPRVINRTKTIFG